MADDSKKLERRFVELGESLASPPSSVDELYSLLDQIDGLLSTVEQSPSQMMLTALRPLMAAVAVKDLLRHPDFDIKVAVASCISEITRITAPEAPYDDDNMKEIFQMIVGTFEGLDNMSSRSFQKRVSILETVAKVRSCVVMLDLECDALILEMFHNFLKTIRINHSENVFSCMETIMTLVIEESEDISPELLSVLLDTLRNNKKDVLPIARRLAEKVMGNCANKIKPCLLELVRSKRAPFSEYHKVVASVCQGNDMLGQNETNSSCEILVDVGKFSERTSSDEPPQVSAQLEREAACRGKVDTSADTSPISAASNGTVQMGNGDSIKQPSSPEQKPEHSSCNGQSGNVLSDPTDGDNLVSVSVKSFDITDIKTEKGQKTNASARLTDTADHSQDESEKGAPEVSKSRDCHTKEADSLEVDDASTREMEPAVPSEPEKKDELQHLSGSENPNAVALPSPNESLRNSARSRKGRPPGSKATAKRSTGGAVADLPASGSVQKGPSVENHTKDEVINAKIDESKKEHDVADDVGTPASLPSDSATKSRGAGKKGRIKKKAVAQEPSGKKNSSAKKQEEGGASKKVVDREPSLKEMSSSRSALKVQSGDKTHLDGSVKPKSRRKRAMETKDISRTTDHEKEVGGRLVGSKIKVWWPDDEMFYDGVVDSYDPDTKRHKIVYTDGDVEVLLLKDEHWKFAESDAEKGEGKRKAKGIASQPPQTKKAKVSPNTMPIQTKLHEQSRSGAETSSIGSPRPRGRPKKGSPDIGKLLFGDTSESSKKSKGKPASDGHAKTPRSSGKPKDVAETERGAETPRTSSKRDELGNKSKDSTSKISEKSKDESSKPVKKLKGETRKATSNLKVYTSKGRGRSREGATMKDSTPITASKSKFDEVAKNKTPKIDGNPKASNVSGKGKTEVEENEEETLVSDGKDSTGGRKRKQKARK